MKEIIDAINTRIKAPYFGYSLLAFAAFNWRGIFLLLASDGTAEVRLAKFDEHTTHLTLVAYPLLVGAAVAASAAWIKLIFDAIAKKPIELIDNLHLDSEHRKTIRKMELEQSRNALFSARERELIERAKRDTEVEGIENEIVRQKVAEEIEALRLERDRLSSQGAPADINRQLSKEELDLLKAAGAGDGAILRIDYIDGSYLKAGNTIFGHKDPREMSRYSAALQALISKSLVQASNDTPGVFALTHMGWQAVDAL